MLMLLIGAAFAAFRYKITEEIWNQMEESTCRLANHKVKAYASASYPLSALTMIRRWTAPFFNSSGTHAPSVTCLVHATVRHEKCPSQGDSCWELFPRSFLQVEDMIPLTFVYPAGMLEQRRHHLRCEDAVLELFNKTRVFTCSYATENLMRLGIFAGRKAQMSNVVVSKAFWSSQAKWPLM